MRWGSLLLSTLTIFFIIFFQWPKIKKNQKKEKIIFIFMSVFGWLLAVTLILFPDLPGPTQIIDFTFKPLGRLLE
jgi:predicted permease